MDRDEHQRLIREAKALEAGGYKLAAEAKRKEADAYWQGPQPEDFQ